MATRALAAAVAGRRLVARTGFPALASSRRGGAPSDSGRRDVHAQAEERDADHGSSVRESRVTAAQVEAALNTKNVEEVAQDLGVRATATAVLPDEAVRNADADAAWVPDQDTGVFVPAEEAAAAASSNGTHGDESSSTASVLDQTVFNREEEMEDVERPPVDMAQGGAGAK